MLIGLKLETLQPEDRTSFWYVLTAARVQYARLWRIKQIPTMENWLYSVIQIVEMDKLTREVKDQVPDEFKECWGKLKNIWNLDGD